MKEQPARNGSRKGRSSHVRANDETLVKEGEKCESGKDRDKARKRREIKATSRGKRRGSRSSSSGTEREKEIRSSVRVNRRKTAVQTSARVKRSSSSSSPENAATKAKTESGARGGESVMKSSSKRVEKVSKDKRDPSGHGEKRSERRIGRH